MTITRATTALERDADVDSIVSFHGARWSDFLRVVAMKGDSSVPRVSYLDGEMELLSPSRGHEGVKSLAGRLLSAYAEEHDLVMNAYGSWTLKQRPKKAGIEPDECYVVGEDKPCPDLAIEVVWAPKSLLEKLEIHRRLGVREVWVWEAGALRVHALRAARYRVVERSEVLPELDLAQLSRFLDREDQTRAVRDFRAAIRKSPRPRR